MATLSCDRDGGKRIQYFDADERRRALRLGSLPERSAQSIKARIEELVSVKHYGGTLTEDTAKWLRDCPAKLHRKLVKLGLAQAREPVAPAVIRTLRQVIDEFHAKRLDVKLSTKANWKQGHESLVAAFGADRDIASITLGEADDWRQRQISAGYRDATIRKQTRMIKQLYHWAKRRDYVSTNPFLDLKSASVEGKSKPYVPKADVLAVLDKLPNHHWRLFFALGRFAGLRLPSEAMALRWSHVHWDTNKIIVPVPKMEYLEQKATREIPIFAELRPWLQTAYEQATPGDDRVIVLPDTTDNMHRKTIKHAIVKAGLIPWKCIYHALRSSCEIDLAEHYPIHVVAKWIGHSVEVAQRFYLEAKDAHFQLAVGDTGEKAAHFTAQSMPPCDGSEQNTTDCTSEEGTEIAVCGDINAEMGIKSGQGRT